MHASGHGLAALLLALPCALPASAACKADGPLATARWVFEHAYGFAAQSTPDAHEFLSPALLAQLEKEWRCKAGGGHCALDDADPWTESHDGAVLDPVVFSLVASPIERRRVAVRYRFGSEAPGSPEPEPARSELSLVQDPATQCWLVDDLASRKDVSLRRRLQQHAY
jgi:hypothetical protein